MKRKLISLLITAALVLSLIPISAIAQTAAAAEEQPPAKAPETAIDLTAAPGEEPDIITLKNITPLTAKESEPTKGATVFQTYDFEYSSNSEFTNEWALYDTDGDGYNWFWDDAGGAVSGNCVITSESYSNDTYSALTPDNWAVSPGVTLPSAALHPYVTFYYAGTDPDFIADHLEVYVATTRTMSGATLLFSETMTTNAWQQATCDLSSFGGRTVYIAFRHCNCTDQFMLAVDYVRFWANEPDSLNSAANAPGNYLLFSSDGSYPWEVAYDGTEPYVKSTNGGTASSTSTLTSSVNVQGGDSLTFDYKAWGEGSKTIWDKCIFNVNGTDVQIWGAHQNDSWETYSYTFPSDGTYSLTWTYSKDSSVNPNGDYFAINNVRLVKGEKENLIRGDYFEDDGSGNPSWRSSWYTADNDGDGNKWIWVYNEGNAPYAYEGSGFFASLSQMNGNALTPDNFAIVGPIPLKAYQNVLTFHMGGLGPDSQNQEHFRVYYSTSLNGGSWTSISNEFTTNGEYQTYSVDLDNYAGQSIYIAFRHYNCTNQTMLRLDAVEFFGTDEAPAPIDTVEIFGFVPPVYGASPNNTDQYIPDGVHYTLNNRTWAYYDPESGASTMPEGAVFDNLNYQYYQVFLILADTGYSFADEVTFRINGREDLVSFTEYHEQGNYTYYVVYSARYTVDDPNITMVELNGFVEPVWGEHPSFNITVPEGAHYTVTFFIWYWYNNGNNHSLSSSDVFEHEDGFYYAYFRIRWDDGYVIPSDATVKLNGAVITPAWQSADDEDFMFETPHYYVQDPNSHLLGDVDFNGAVNATDAIHVLRHAMNIAQLSGEALTVADVDGNGNVNFTDAIFILRYAMHIIGSFPAQN